MLEYLERGERILYMITKITDIFTVRNRKLLVLAALLVSITLIFLTTYRTRNVISNIDGVSYLSIARQYSDGHVQSAVNAYWSPMLSWLTAIGITFGMDDVNALAYVNFLSAVGILIIGLMLIKKVTGNWFQFGIIYLATATPFLTSATPIFTPDVLVIAWVLSFCYSLLWAHEKFDGSATRNEKIKAVILLGFIGATGYFTKLFLLPLFFFAILGWGVFRFLIAHKKNKKVVKKLLLETGFVFIAFFVFAAPWIGLLSLKYDHVTLGSSFAVNSASRFNAEGLEREFFPVPPNKYAVSFVEDPTPKEDVVITSGSTKEINYYINERLKAAPFYANRINEISPFILPTLFLGVLYVVFVKFNFKEKADVLLLLMVAILYTLGYWNAADATGGGGNTRYVWPVFFVVIVVFLRAARELYASLKPNVYRMLFLCMVVAFLPYSSYLRYMRGMGYMFTIPIAIAPLSVRESVRGSVYRISTNTVLTNDYLIAQRLKKENVIPKGSKISSNNIRQAVVLSYWLKTQTFGAPGNNYTLKDPNYVEIARSFGVEYFLRYTPVPNDRQVLIRTDLPVVYTFFDVMPCHDTRSAPHEDCLVEVIKL